MKSLSEISVSWQRFIDQNRYGEPRTDESFFLCSVRPDWRVVPGLRRVVVALSCVELHLKGPFFLSSATVRPNLEIL